MQIVKRYSTYALVLTKKIAKSLLTYTLGYSLPLFLCVYVQCVCDMCNTLYPIQYYKSFDFMNIFHKTVILSQLTVEPYLKLQERTVKYQEKYLLLF